MKKEENNNNSLIWVDGKITRSSSKVSDVNGGNYSWKGNKNVNEGDSGVIIIKKKERSNKNKKEKQVCFVDEIKLDKPIPLVEVVNVVSYKKYNVTPYGRFLSFKCGNYDGRACCSCGCAIY